MPGRNIVSDVTDSLGVLGGGGAMRKVIFYFAHYFARCFALTQLCAPLPFLLCVFASVCGCCALLWQAFIFDNVQVSVVFSTYYTLHKT